MHAKVLIKKKKNMYRVSEIGNHHGMIFFSVIFLIK